MIWRKISRAAGSAWEFASDFVGLALGLLFGIVSIVLAKIDSARPLLPYTLLLTFVSVLIDFARRLRELRRLVTSKQKIRQLGAGNVVLREVLDLTSKAQLVRNTFILFNLSEKDVLLKGYSENDLAYIKQKVRSFVDDGGQWDDIVSSDVVNLPKLAWHSLIHNNVPRYSLRRVKSRYPVINFLLIYHPDGRSEVVFGWGHHLQDPTGNVFLSDDQPVVKMFEHYWDILYSDSVAPDQGKLPIDPSDIEGTWFRVAYHIGPDDQAEDLNLLNGPPSDVAIVCVTKEDSGRNIRAHGYRYLCEGYKIKRHLEDFHSVAVDLVDARLWFATKKQDRDEFVAGWYEFSDYNQARRPWKFFGEFTESPLERRPTTSGAPGKLAIYGCRLMFRPGSQADIAFDDKAGGAADYQTHLPQHLGDAAETRSLAEKCLVLWQAGCPWTRSQHASSQ